MSSGDARRTVALSEALPALAARYVPITRWLPTYARPWLRADAAAAITSWGVMVPVALAYAGLAGVSPEVGLVTAFTALAAYAVLGTSRHLKVTTSSTMAIMSASVVADLAGGDAVAWVTLTSALALTVGAILVVAGLARLGFIADFLTKSVVTGFIFGLAITIIIGQIPKLLGTPSVSGPLPQQVVQLIDSIPETNPWTLAVGLASLAVILGLRAISRRIPGALVALVVGTLAVVVLDLKEQGVMVVGEVATGVPLPSLPLVALTDLPYLAIGAVGIVFLAVGESVGAGRAYAARHGYQLDPDQEMLALGGANIASGLFGGFATDASLTQTATAEAAGARSQVSSLITSGLILATAIVLAPLFRNLPNAVLGAIVIAAVLTLMDVAELRRYWAWRRTDFLLAITAMVGVLLTTVLTGLVIAVGLSVAFVLYRASRPHVAAVGRMPGHRATFGDLSRHPEAELIPRLVIVRLDAPLYFFNADVARGQVVALIDERNADARGVLLDLAATADLDVTTTDMLAGLVRELRTRGIEVLLAQVKSAVRDRMRRTGLLDLVGEDRVYLSVSSAVNDFLRRWPPEGEEGPEAETVHAASPPPRTEAPDGRPAAPPGTGPTGDDRPAEPPAPILPG